MIFHKGRAVFGALAVAALFVATSCQNPSSTPTATSSYKDYLYMTDTVSGKVYTYDPSTQTASSSSYATVGQNATGEIQFYNGIGYAAVGYGTNEGVYYFDPSATNPSFTKLGAGIAAQYFAFYSATKAYVSAYDYSGTTSGLYSFDPSSPSSGLTELGAFSGKYLQELVIAPDGYLYAADNGNKAVYRISPASGALDATIGTSAGGVTGLAAGTYNGSAGVFVADTGGYDSATWAALPGSIDFILSSAANGSTATSVASATSASVSIYPARVVQVSSGNLVATGYGHSYVAALSGSSATVTELKNASDSSFGSLDIAYKDGLVYIPVTSGTTGNYTNYLYVLDASGNRKSYSPVSVMTTTDSLSNIGFYE